MPPRNPRRPVHTITSTFVLGLLLIASPASALEVNSKIPDRIFIQSDDRLRTISQNDGITPFSTDAVTSSPHGARDLNRDSKLGAELDTESGVVQISTSEKIHSQRMVKSKSFLVGEDRNGLGHIRAFKNNGDIQLGAILPAPMPTAEISYDVDVSGGGKVVTDGKAAVVIAPDGQMVGGFDTAWARDSRGRPVDTEYVVRGRTLVQKVDLSDESIAYPVTTDPLFKRGMIRRVNHEKWKRGAWVVQVEVTGAARLMRAYNWRQAATLGYADLVDHYPRSMKKATMRQQWDCHILGLYGTFKIDLEGYRKSKPNWARTEIWKAVKLAYKKKKASAVARACNW